MDDSKVIYIRLRSGVPFSYNLQVVQWNCSILMMSQLSETGMQSWTPTDWRFIHSNQRAWMTVFSTYSLHRPKLLIAKKVELYNCCIAGVIRIWCNWYDLDKGKYYWCLDHRLQQNLKPWWVVVLQYGITSIHYSSFLTELRTKLSQFVKVWFLRLK